jgi:S1-C subfamily serine protease
MNEIPEVAAPVPRRRRTGLVAVATLGTVGIAAGVVLGVGAASRPTPVVGQGSAAHFQPAVNGFGGFGARRFGDGTLGGGASGGLGGGSTAPTSAATGAQQVGVVDVATTLGYQNAATAGTGMVLTSTGDVLTNNHVISGATSITVTVVSTGASYTASVLGTDPSSDIAVLHLADASGLTTADVSTAPATVGETVTAIGNAGGTGTLTSAGGTVTALDRSITATDADGSNAEHLSGLIETDAAVQPGDSGGPLYDTTGAIVGMDTAASSSGPAQAYAIPISTAERIATQIENGVSSATIHQGYPAFLGVSVGDGGGATVLGVLANGPAAKAGVTAGDVITAVAHLSVTSAADLSTALAGHSPGQHVTVTWADATGVSHSATVTLGTGPAQ